MLKASCFLLFSFMFTHSASADLIFMRESKENGKQIILKTEAGIKQLTHGSDFHLYPDLSQDGSLAVWVEGSEKDLKVVTYTIETMKKEIWNFSGYKGLILQPKFSKNGRWLVASAQIDSSSTDSRISRIVYFSPMAEKLKPDVKRTVYANGDIEYQITPQYIEEALPAYFPRPSSDFGFLVYHRSNPETKKREVVFHDRIQNTSEVISEGMSPNLSPDESLVLFTKNTGESWDIFAYDRFSKKITQMTNDPKNEMAPTMPPSGDLVFSSDCTGHYQLYQLKNGITEQLTHGDFDDYAAQFSGETAYQQGLLPEFIGKPRSSFGTVYHQGNLYMVGGHQGPEHTYPEDSFSDELYRFDGKAWKKLTSRPHKAHGYQVVAHEQFLYAFGGFAFDAARKPSWHSLDSVDRYDIANDRWETVSTMPRRRSSNAAVVIGKKVYLIGGWDSTPRFENDSDGRFHSEIDIFDLETQTFTVAPYSIPDPVRRAFTATSYQGKIILMGGIGAGSSHFDLLKRVTMLDPNTGFFTELPQLPFATFAPAAEILGNELLAFGGMFKTGETQYEYVSHIYALDFNDLKWRHTGRYLQETKGFSQAFRINNDTIGILGGHHYFQGYDEPVPTFEVFSRKN